MNVEFKPRTISFIAPVSANDNTDRVSVDRDGHMPADRRRAVIYRPSKPAMTSGCAGTKRWLLEFQPASAPFIEPLMDWTGSTDPVAHTRLSFPTREAAVTYAKSQGLDYEVRDSAKPTKTATPLDPRLMQPIALWPIDVLSDQNLFLMFEMADFVPNLAA